MTITQCFLINFMLNFAVVVFDQKILDCRLLKSTYVGGGLLIWTLATWISALAWVIYLILRYPI